MEDSERSSGTVYWTLEKMLITAQGYPWAVMFYEALLDQLET